MIVENSFPKKWQISWNTRRWLLHKIFSGIQTFLFSEIDDHKMFGTDYFISYNTTVNCNWTFRLSLLKGVFLRWKKCSYNMLKQSLAYASSLDTQMESKSEQTYPRPLCSHLGYLDMHVFVNIAHTRNDVRKY